MDKEQVFRLKQRAEAETVFTKCLTAMDFEPTTDILNSVYDLLM